MDTTQPRSTFIRADDDYRIEVTVHGNSVETILDHFTAYLAASGFDRAAITAAFTRTTSLLKGQQGQAKAKPGAK